MTALSAAARSSAAAPSTTLLAKSVASSAFLADSSAASSAFLAARSACSAASFRVQPMSAVLSGRIYTIHDRRMVVTPTAGAQSSDRASCMPAVRGTRRWREGEMCGFLFVVAPRQTLRPPGFARPRLLAAGFCVVPPRPGGWGGRGGPRQARKKEGRGGAAAIRTWFRSTALPPPRRMPGPSGSARTGTGRRSAARRPRWPPAGSCRSPRSTCPTPC